MAGLYANFANVSHSDYEFTITFARVDHEVEDERDPGRRGLARQPLAALHARADRRAWRTTTRSGRRARASRTCPSSTAPTSRRADAARIRRTPAATRGSCAMRVAIISDIHGNLPRARGGARRTSSRTGADELWCLGDLVGYGAEPDACVALARAPRARSAWPATTTSRSRGELPLDEFSRGAGSPPEWTQEVIAPETLEFLLGAGAAGRLDEARRPLPRLPARPGLGVRALAAAGRAVPRRDWSTACP